MCNLAFLLLHLLLLPFLVPRPLPILRCQTRGCRRLDVVLLHLAHALVVANSGDPNSGCVTTQPVVVETLPPRDVVVEIRHPVVLPSRFGFRHPSDDNDDDEEEEPKPPPHRRLQLPAPPPPASLRLSFPPYPSLTMMPRRTRRRTTATAILRCVSRDERMTTTAILRCVRRDDVARDGPLTHPADASRQRQRQIVNERTMHDDGDLHSSPSPLRCPASSGEVGTIKAIKEEGAGEVGRNCKKKQQTEKAAQRTPATAT
jgi:hypothetical protein